MSILEASFEFEKFDTVELIKPLQKKAMEPLKSAKTPKA